MRKDYLSYVLTSVSTALLLMFSMSYSADVLADTSTGSRITDLHSSIEDGDMYLLWTPLSTEIQTYDIRMVHGTTDAATMTTLWATLECNKSFRSTTPCDAGTSASNKVRVVKTPYDTMTFGLRVKDSQGNLGNVSNPHTVPKSNLFSFESKVTDLSFALKGGNQELSWMPTRSGVDTYYIRMYQGETNETFIQPIWGGLDTIICGQRFCNFRLTDPVTFVKDVTKKESLNPHIEASDFGTSEKLTIVVTYKTTTGNISQPAVITISKSALTPSTTPPASSTGSVVTQTGSTLIDGNIRLVSHALGIRFSWTPKASTITGYEIRYAYGQLANDTFFANWDAYKTAAINTNHPKTSIKMLGGTRDVAYVRVPSGFYASQDPSTITFGIMATMSDGTKKPLAPAVYLDRLKLFLDRPALGITDPLDNPIGPKAIRVAEGEVTLSWPEIPNASTYIIYYGTQPLQSGSGSILLWQVDGATTATIPGLKNFTPYYFAITAIDAQGIESRYFSPQIRVVPRATRLVDSIQKIYNDTLDSDWFATYVKMLYERKAINEDDSKKSYRPADPINRAELVKLLVKTIGVDVSKISVSSNKIFCDVSPNHWFAPYVSYLYSKSWIEGYKEGNCSLKRVFGPDRYITRAEVVKLIFFNFTPKSKKADRTTVPFSDVTKDDWFYQYVEFAYQYGIIDGFTDNTFRPYDQITRAEAAKLLARLISQEETNEEK